VGDSEGCKIYCIPFLATFLYFLLFLSLIFILLVLEFSPSIGGAYIKSMTLREGLSFSFSRIFSGYLEPGGSNTNMGFGFGAV